MRARSLMGQMAVVLVWAAGSAAEPVEADAKAKHEARGLLQEGLVLFEARSWGEALAKFEQAYSRYRSPKLLANIGAAYYELNRPVEALEAYEQFLAARVQGVSPVVVAEARAQVGRLQRRVGHVAVEAPGGTDVTIDGVALGQVPIQPVRLKVGVHRVTLVVPNAGAFELIAEVRRGETVHVAPPKKGDGPTVAAPSHAVDLATGTEAQPRQGSQWRWAHDWRVWAGVGAVIVTGVLVGVFVATDNDAGDGGAVTPNGSASGLPIGDDYIYLDVAGQM